ncbi:hypothetical protein GALMADRAFT_134077 [Galerina marginata CBS 339.88]|uniref:Uncharacterized protein n=1 Tax=Galerina marginata (strain CBS 339.88) TaxID=685588 RepID=A0A067TH77_GALM3|nr:hypothetical protein GALMADRAFT_134077 [Galerina marginata CBS 339.88]
MPPSRLIIELNRCFEPSPWNTGPRIPSTEPMPEKTPTTSSPFNEAVSDPYAALRRETYTPDLTNSPASSVSSALSLSLEDEEIKKIFANPKYDHQAGNSSKDLLEALASQLQGDFDWNVPVEYSGRKEELNPHAVPFVPSFAIPTNLHHPFNTISMDYLQPSPLDLDFAPLAFPSKSITPGQPPLPHDSPYLHSVPLPPLYPPGLPHPVMQSTQPISESEPAEPPFPPRYLPVLLEALSPATSSRERGVLAHVIVTTFPAWDMENLLELAELLCEAAAKPPAELSESRWIVCNPSRYLPAQNDLRFYNHADDERKPENIVAKLAEDLHTHLTQLHGDKGQIFAWNLRETVLMQFIQCWDCAKPTSIAYETNPPPQYVRSGLTLCKLIAALFKHGLITREHISMCISVLFKDLMSVEHVEALANIVLGCGPPFWASPSPGSPAQVDAASATPSDTFLLAKVEEAKVQLNDHVNNFLAGLELNLINSGLTDERSVLGQSWGDGQLLALIKDIVDSVKLWEAVLMTTPAKSGSEQQSGPSATN